MKLTKTFKELCTPAMIYFVISIIAILIALTSHVKPAAVLIKAIFVVFWTFVLNFLCKKGYKSVSWFLVLFPYIIILAAVFGIVREGNANMTPDSSPDSSAISAAAMNAVANSLTKTGSAAAPTTSTITSTSKPAGSTTSTDGVAANSAPCTPEGYIRGPDGKCGPPPLKPMVPK